MQPLGKSGSHPIVFDPSLWAQFAPQPQAPAARPQPQAQHGRGGFLSSIISELGGAGGAAGGAAAGAAAGSIVPGVGTVVGGLAGAILGGFAGGTGGRLIENKVRDNKYNVGSAVKEGALDAALSGLGTGYQALKGVRNVKNLTKVLPEAEGIAQAPARTGAIEQAGYNIKAGAGGYSTGAKVNGEKIGMAQSKQIDDLLNKLKIPTGSPEARQAALESHISNMNSTLSDLYGKNVQRVQPKSLGAAIMADVSKLPLIDNAAKKSAEDFVNGQLKGVKNTNDLWAIIKSIDANKIKWGGSPSAKLVDREAVARAIRSNIRDVLNKKLPGVANTNSLYHDAITANELLKGISTNSGGGLFGTIKGLGPVKALESKAGSAIEKTGRMTAGTGGPTSKVVQQAKFQAPANLTEALSGLTAQPAETATDISVPGSMPGDQSAPQGPYYDPTDPFGQGSQLTTAYSASTAAGAGTPESDSTYSEQNLIADISRDPKHMSQYLDLYKTLASLEAAKAKANKAGGANIGKVSSQNFSNAQSGYAALQSLSDLYKSDPGVIQRAGTPGRGLPLVGGIIANKSNTTQMDALAANVADKYIRLTTGATANADEIKTLKTQKLPRPGDTPAQAQYKLNQFASLFQSILEQAQGQGGGSDLTDVLSQLQTQGAY